MWFPNLPWVFFALDLFLRVYFCLRIIQRRHPVAVSWAWLTTILFLPIGGTILYLYLGEYRLERRRKSRLMAAEAAVHQLVQENGISKSFQQSLTEPAQSFARAASGIFCLPIVPGNDIELLRDADAAFPRMLADIEQAKHSCDLETYIWWDGGRADLFGEALIRAAHRGVRCRVLVDQLGSAAFLRGTMVEKLRRAGVQVVPALRANLFLSFFSRPDLRLHRKIFIVDDSIGYTGSLNLADPIVFKKDAGVGQWVDAVCRLRGPAVRGLSYVFFADWSSETSIDFAQLNRESRFENLAQKESCSLQFLPSGPASPNSKIEQLLIDGIYSARRELILTTPYFVPSEAMLYALKTSAARGVAVTVVVPERVDSKLTQYASQAFLGELVRVGVSIAQYQAGLLHTKSLTVDGNFCLFGSLNLDPRSLRINFEITLAIYDEKFTADLVELQRRYIAHAKILESQQLLAPSASMRFREDLARLTGPLL